jgi:hypothetical protein
MLEQKECPNTGTGVCSIKQAVEHRSVVDYQHPSVRDRQEVSASKSNAQAVAITPSTTIRADGNEPASGITRLPPWPSV